MSRRWWIQDGAVCVEGPSSGGPLRVPEPPEHDGLGILIEQSAGGVAAWIRYVEEDRRVHDKAAKEKAKRERKR